MSRQSEGLLRPRWYAFVLVYQDQQQILESLDLAHVLCLTRGPAVAPMLGCPFDSIRLGVHYSCWQPSLGENRAVAAGLDEGMMKYSNALASASDVARGRYREGMERLRLASVAVLPWRGTAAVE